MLESEEHRSKKQASQNVHWHEAISVFISHQQLSSQHQEWPPGELKLPAATFSLSYKLTPDTNVVLILYTLIICKVWAEKGENWWTYFCTIPKTSKKRGLPKWLYRQRVLDLSPRTWVWFPESMWCKERTSKFTFDIYPTTYTWINKHNKNKVEEK